MSKGGKLTIAILLGIVLGVITGFSLKGHYMPLMWQAEMVAPDALWTKAVVAGVPLLHSGVEVIGKVFLNLLKMVIVPLVFASLVTGMISAGDIRKSGRLGLKTLVYYAVTTGISVLIGLFLVNIIKPGIGINLAGRADVETIETAGSLTHVFKSLIPGNPIEALAAGKILSIIFVALLFGAVLTTLPRKAVTVIGFFEGLNAVMLRATRWIMYTAPLGVFGLTAGLFAEFGVDVIKPVAKYFSTVTAGLLIHGLVVLPLVLLVFARRNPFSFGVGMMPSLMTAFSTASSSSTLPLTLECAEENNGISNRVASFVLPIGATINMDGTALYEAVAAMTIAQAYGIELGLGAQTVVFLTATLAAVGAAGIPSAGLVTMGIVLKAVGLPLEGIGLILAVDRLLDMMRTTVNVWGDSVGTGVIEALEPSVAPAAVALEPAGGGS